MRVWLSIVLRTLLLNVAKLEWSIEIIKAFGLSVEFLPALVESHALVGTVLDDFAQKTGISEATKVFAGGLAEAIGSGILIEERTLASIETSGVVLSYEVRNDLDFEGKVHYFNHCKENAYYTRYRI